MIIYYETFDKLFFRYSITSSFSVQLFLLRSRRRGAENLYEKSRTESDLNPSRQANEAKSDEKRNLMNLKLLIFINGSFM